MITLKKWYWLLTATVLSLVLWTFIGVNTGVFQNGKGGYEYWSYLSSYALVIGFWGLVAIKAQISEKLKALMSYVVFGLTPFFCMQITMLLSGAAEYSFEVYFINLLFYISLTALMLAVTRSFTWSGVISIIIAFMFNIASFVLYILRGSPLIPGDFLAIGTAAQVAENYTFDMRYQIVAATVVTAIVVALNLHFYTKVTFKRKNIILPITGALAVVIFYGSLNCVDYSKISMDTFDQYHANNTYGTPYSFYINTRRMILKKPEDYSGGNARSILSTYKNIEEIGEEKPDIIVIMNESLSDLKAVGNFDTNIDYFPNMNAMSKDTVKGELLVSPFGGYTCNTEFEFLTNLSMGLLPTGSTPYLQYISKPMEYTLPKHLKSLGYKSVALHPYYKQCWNREKVYKNLGFDQFIGIEDLPNLVPEDRWEYIRYYLSDRTDYEAVKSYLEANGNEEPLFMFNITMQNHGGYTYEGSEFPTVTMSNMNGSYKETEQYLSLVHESDKAFNDLVKYLKKRNRKTIVLIFGDHQPAVEQGLFEELYGKKIDSLTTEELQSRYKVPFLIWANYDIEEGEGIKTSANFLSNLLLDTANMPKNDIGNFTSHVHENILQMNAMGHFDMDGFWHDNEFENDGLLKDYNKVEYYSVTAKEK